MSLLELQRDADNLRRERIVAARLRLARLLKTYRAYTTVSLCAHFDNVIGRCLRRHDDGRMLETSVDEIESFLIAHKRRCDKI